MPLEGFHPSVSTKKSLLADVIGVLSVTKDAVAGSVRDGLVTSDQLREGLPVTILGLLNKYAILQLSNGR